ncbi:tetratricopeptide repeat protein [Aeromonas veronii]
MEQSELPVEIKELIKKSEAGDAESQYILGAKYKYGRGVEKSYKNAFTWFSKAAEQEYAFAQNSLGIMYDNGEGVERSSHKAVELYRKAAEKGYDAAQFNLGLMYIDGDGVEKDYLIAQELFHQASKNTDSKVYLDAIEMKDLAERYQLSEKITTIREDILTRLEADTIKTPTMTHYTSLTAGHSLLFEQSPLRLGHINSLNDPNEGKLLWRYLGHEPIEGKPIFIGCFLPDDDSLNMWRFYSKNLNNDDACGCAITFNTNDFFKFNLVKKPPTETPSSENETTNSSTWKSPQDRATFYRIIYMTEGMNIHDDDKAMLEKLFYRLKREVDKFTGNEPNNEKLQQLSRLLGPLPYLLKDADYEAEKEHRIIVTHLEYGSHEIQVLPPILENGIPQTSPKLYLELHREKHLAPVKHITLGPKAPHQDMMAPYWHHELARYFTDQVRTKPDFYVRISKCAYK